MPPNPTWLRNLCVCFLVDRPTHVFPFVEEWMAGNTTILLGGRMLWGIATRALGGVSTRALWRGSCTRAQQVVRAWILSLGPWTLESGSPFLASAEGPFNFRSPVFYVSRLFCLLTIQTNSRPLFFPSSLFVFPFWNSGCMGSELAGLVSLTYISRSIKG